MGAKTWMLVYAEHNAREALRAQPTLDRAATTQLAEKLFPQDRLIPVEDGSLDFTCPPDDIIEIGCFAGVSVVAAKEFGIDHPTQLPRQFLSHGTNGKITLHAMHSVVDWFAYALWDKGTLVRSLSLAPDYGFIENIGEPLAFEKPYWEGLHPALDPEEDPSEYPFPFHPLELGEAALRACFGYVIEGMYESTDIDATTIPLMRFQRHKRTPWWKFWR